MDAITEIFNNRELALISWTIIFIGLFLLKKSIRQAVMVMIRAFFQRYILIIFLLTAIYVCLQVLVFYKLNLWGFSLVKDTVYWFIGVGSVHLVNSSEYSRDPNRLKRVILQNITLVIFIEFLVNLYVFDYWIEMIVLPIVTLHVLVAAFSEGKSKYLPAKRFANFIVGLVGFVVLIYIVVNIATDFQSFWTINNLGAFLLPPLLLVTFMPFLYLLSLYMCYEVLFTRLKIFLRKDIKTLNYAKRKIFGLCHIDLWKLNRFTRKNARLLYRKNDESEIQRIIEVYKGSAPDSGEV